ncbi:MAG: hypothetical protein HYS76_01090 [Candidatus Wildermuthbacteria bacterium]|nr:hypothetical protein [Candidatus Wildermuthbacteria bacterium]
MRNYELTIFFDSSVGTQESHDALGRLCSFVQENGGLVESQNVKPGIAVHGRKGRDAICFMASVRCAIEQEKLPGIRAYLAKTRGVVQSVLLQAKAKQRFVPAIPRRIMPSRIESDEQKKGAIDIANVDKEIEEIIRA